MGRPYFRRWQYLFFYIGLPGKADNSHVFKVTAEQLLFGGIEVSCSPVPDLAAERR
jgi:hypothetical protein